MVFLLLQVIPSLMNEWALWPLTLMIIFYPFMMVDYIWSTTTYQVFLVYILAITEPR